MILVIAESIAFFYLAYKVARSDFTYWIGLWTGIFIFAILIDPVLHHFFNVFFAPWNLLISFLVNLCWYSAALLGTMISFFKFNTCVINSDTYGTKE